MTSNTTRRTFLKRTGMVASAGLAGPLAMNLAAFGEAAAQTATDYKALVCIFLLGGNDYANTLVTYDQQSYDFYKIEREKLAIERGTLTPLVPKTALPDGRQYALSPHLKNLKVYFDAGQLAVMMNVGALVKPLEKTNSQMTGTAFLTQNAPNLPRKLFSHNDQQGFIQSGGIGNYNSGFGGRLGDVFLDSNAADGGNSVFTCINVDCNGNFGAGNKGNAYGIDTTGPVKINGLTDLYGSAPCKDVFLKLITGKYLPEKLPSLLIAEHTAIVGRSIAAQVKLGPAVEAHPARTKFPTENVLADQLKMVSRVIASRATLLGNGSSVKRQVFFLTLGGFDTHNGLHDTHERLLPLLDEAMFHFYEETKALGIQNHVTTFTASDFGRTMNSDGDGSDHGWGGMQFVLGGAVRGQEFYGRAPRLNFPNEPVPERPFNDGPDDVGRGRLIPSVSTDEYAAEFGRWFGLDEAQLQSLLPNLQNFRPPNDRPNMKFLMPRKK